MADPWAVPVGEVELCVQGFGDPADPPLLLLSGAAASMDWWDVELCERLAAGGRYVLRYDHRDTGRSTTGAVGSPSYSGAQLDRDCAGLLDALALGPVHLMGISMGGGIAQSVAARRPDLVASLVLQSTTAFGGVDADLPGPTAAVRASFDSPPPQPDWDDVESYTEWSLAGERAFAGEIPLDEPRLRAIAAIVHARSIDPAAASNHWLVVGESDDSDDSGDDGALDVHDIAVPTLVVHGSADPMFPLPHGEALAEAIPGARLLVVPGMGHQVPPPQTWDLLVPAVLEHTA